MKHHVEAAGHMFVNGNGRGMYKPGAAQALAAVKELQVDHGLGHQI